MLKLIDGSETMTTKESNWAVGIIYHACPICCEKINPEIIIPQRLTKFIADEVRQADGKIVGFADKPCPECTKYLDKDYIAIIGFDPEQTEHKDGMVRLQDLYRVGLAWLHKRAAQHIFPSWFEDNRTEPFIVVDKQTFEELMRQAEMVNNTEEQAELEA